MKKIAIVMLVVSLGFVLAGDSLAAKKKMPKGARPVFPKNTGQAPVEAAAAKTAPAPVAKVKNGWSAEVGYGGGGAVIEGVYGRQFREGIFLSGGLGYGLGNGYSVVVLDPIRATFDRGAYSFGLGLNYAMYSSSAVGNLFGVASPIPSQNMIGLEIFGEKKIDKYIGRLAFSTALGLRASVVYEF